MKTFVKSSILCSAILAGSSLNMLAAEEAHEHHGGPPGRHEAVLVEVTASVEAIDPKTREVTLKGPMGNEVTFTVDERVKRFDEIKVGDHVHADYYVSVAAELRKPTAEEEKNPLVVLDAAGKAPPGTSPAAGGLRRFKVVTTVEGLDRPTQSITVKGPMGHYLTTRVADPANLTKMHIGDHIVVVYTEALAISLEKTQKTSD
jgi:Cu/Ag efflux protein CusF